MDIRSIIDSEDTPSTRKASTPAPKKQEYRPSTAGLPSTPVPAYDSHHDVRPPQPSPLQTPAQNGPHFITANTHDTLRSPYQRTPSFGLSNGQYPPTQVPNQSPLYSHQAPYYPPREGNSANGPLSSRSFGHSTPSQTPTASTPGSTGAYSGFQRPTSSHSIPTPNSTQQSSGFFRESPQPSNIDTRALSQSQGGQQYTSQPGTPLGPPATYNRPSFNIHRESPGTYNYQRSPSGEIAGPSEIQRSSVVTRGSPSAYREPRSSVQGHGAPRERERSLSVSPKTRLPSLSSNNRLGSMEVLPDLPPDWSEQITTIKRDVPPIAHDSARAGEPQLKRTPSRSIGVSGLLNAETPSEMPERVYRTSQTMSPSNKEQDSDLEILDHNPVDHPLQCDSPVASERVSQHAPSDSMSRPALPLQAYELGAESTAPGLSESASPSQNPSSTADGEGTPQSLQKLPSQPEVVSSFKQMALKTSNGLINTPLPQTQKGIRGKKLSKRSVQELDGVEKDAMLSQPAKKKLRLEEPRRTADPTCIEKPPSKFTKSTTPRVTRYEDVPIYAHSVRGNERTKKLFESNQNGTRQGLPEAPQPPDTALVRSNGAANGVPGRAPAMNDMSIEDGMLGPWECNITNQEPLDELTRVVSDFIFISVFSDESIGVAPAGGGRGLGAIYEIEAKVGRIIDLNTNDRIRLPVENECVISRSDPSIKTRFESSMTQQQHATLNKFLNTAFMASRSSKPSQEPLHKPRIPMSYKHTHETDMHYGLSQRGAMQLPRSLGHGKKPPKVRVTTDDKSGEILAKIIKTPIADMHVYCPRSLFDWRISVNVEMDFNGDMKDLVAADKRDTKGDRKKDRVSYKHLQYQIDLTQVTSAEAENRTRTHELEVEVSSEQVRRQGRLLQQGNPNKYPELIKGFVDNVRLLARSVTA